MSDSNGTTGPELPPESARNADASADPEPVAHSEGESAGADAPTIVAPVFAPPASPAAWPAADAAPAAESTANPPTPLAAEAWDRSLAVEQSLGGATIVEPAPPPVDETPVAPVTPRSRVSGRVRWGAALLVVALVVGATAVAFAALSAGSSLSTLAGWAPTDTYAYGEVRLDLPGDQRQAVADLLSHFPGFADESSLDQKVNLALDRLITDLSSGKASYSDIQPWLGNAAAVAAHGSVDATTKAPQFLMAVSIANATLARDWIAKHDTLKANETTATYNGAQLTLYTAPNGQTEALSVLDTVILAGDEASVKQAIDSKGASGFPSVPNVKAAVATIDGSPLGFAYVDIHRYMSAILAAAPMAGTVLGSSITDKVPAWVALTARARSDGLQVDLVEPAVAGGPTATSRTSSLASRLPASTVVAIEVHDLGTALRTGLDSLKQQDVTKDAANQVDQALTALGGFDSLVGWAGDADIVVIAHDGGVDGGLVIAATDEKAASGLAATLRNFASLAGATGTGGVTLSDEPYGEGSITVVDLGDVSSLAQMAGNSVPIQAGMHAGFAYSVQKGLVVIGSTDTFVKSVLDTASGSSLADQDRYKQALDRAGASNVGQGYVDIAGIANAIEAVLPADSRTRYETDVKPYVTPFGAIAWSTSGGDPIRMRAVVTIH